MEVLGRQHGRCNTCAYKRMNGKIIDLTQPCNVVTIRGMRILICDKCLEELDLIKLRREEEDADTHL